MFNFWRKSKATAVGNYINFLSSDCVWEDSIGNIVCIQNQENKKDFECFKKHLQKCAVDEPYFTAITEMGNQSYRVVLFFNLTDKNHTS